MDAFVYSPMLSQKLQGVTYDGLFHIADWFPTILQLTGTSFAPKEGFELDGVSHVDSWNGAEYPRANLLYNAYTNVDFYSFNIWSNGSFAIRDERFKLMHAFDSTTYGAWYENVDLGSLDSETRCAPQLSLNDGDFTVTFRLLNIHLM